MHNYSLISVYSLWVVSGLVAYFCTSKFTEILGLCNKSQFVLKLSTSNTQVFPRVNITFNRLVLVFNHINHRTYKSNNYLYKLITINKAENL